MCLGKRFYWWEWWGFLGCVCERVEEFKGKDEGGEGIKGGGVLG